MLIHRFHTVVITVLLSASLSACGGGGGDNGGNPPIDAQADAFRLTPATFDDVLPGDSVEASAKITGFDGTLEATFTTEGPITATLRNGKTGKEAKSVDFKVGDTLFVRLTVNDDAEVGDNFSLKLGVGSGDTTVDASLQGTAGDGSAPTVSIDFPLDDAISLLPQLTLSGRAGDDVGVSDVRVIEHPEAVVQLADDGSWSIQDVPLLGNGFKTLTVEVTDAAGNSAQDSVTVFHDMLVFDEPVAVFALAENDVLVLDDATDSLYRVNTAAGSRELISGPESEGAATAPMRHPVDMDVDVETGVVYVLNQGPVVNGVLAIDLATRTRSLLSSEFDGLPPDGMTAGSGHVWSEPSRVSFFNNVLYVADGQDVVAVKTTDGERGRSFEHGSNIDDIVAGTFKRNDDSITGLVILAEGEIGVKRFDGSLLRPMIGIDGKWLAPVNDVFVGVLEEVATDNFDFPLADVYGLDGSAPLLPYIDPVDGLLLADATAAAQLAGNTFVYTKRRGERLLKLNGTAVSYLVSNARPTLNDGTALAERLDDAPDVAANVDPATGKLYFQKGSGDSFKLVSYDPETRVFATVIDGIDPALAPLKDRASDEWAVQDGKVYVRVDYPDTNKDGIYVIDTDACLADPSDIAACISALITNGDQRAASGELLFQNSVTYLSVRDGVLVTYGDSDPVVNGFSSSDDYLLSIDATSGSLLDFHFVGVESETTKTVGNLVLLASGPRIASVDLASADPFGSFKVVSTCGVATTASLTCEENDDHAGLGPAFFNVDDLVRLDADSVAVTLKTETPDPYGGDIPLFGGGLYEIDLVTGDRTLLFGRGPFDGNLQTNGVPDVISRLFFGTPFIDWSISEDPERGRFFVYHEIARKLYLMNVGRVSDETGEERVINQAVLVAE